MPVEAKPSKLAKLDGFKRSLPFMTATALSEVVNKIKSEGLPAASSRKDIRDAAQLKLMDKGYGNIIKKMKVACKDGSERDLVLANPLALLQAAFSQGGSYYQLVQSVLEAKPCSFSQSWHAMFYMDEVQNGNQLGVHQGRKCWLMYFAIEEFGPVILQREVSWLTLLVERTTKVQELHAGVSQVFATVMKSFFADPTWDMEAGLLLKGPPGGKNARIFLKLGSLLQDGGAHKAVFHAKGDSATRLCFMCSNLVAAKSKLVDGENQLTCKLMATSELCMASDSDIKETIKRIKHRSTTLSSEDFKLYLQCTGFNYEPFGLLFSEELEKHIQPVTAYIHDWMHTLVANGVFHTIFTAWLDAAQVHLDIYKELSSYIAVWKHPKSKNLHLLFSAKRKASNKDAGVFKCDASDALSLCPLVVHYMQKTFVPASMLLKETNAT